MKRYLVGGAVRDELLGLPVSRPRLGRRRRRRRAADRGRLSCRWAPTSRSSCIPQTHEEYALARTERKTAPGYHGFAFHAGPERHARGGPAAPRPDDQRDGAGRGRRADRPLRRPGAISRTQVLAPRLAGLRRRPGAHPAPGALRRALPDFSVAPETEALMRQMVEAGEVDALVPERVWQEVSRGLMEAQAVADVRGAARLRRARAGAARGGRACSACRSRADYHPEVDTGVHLMMVLDMAARLGHPLAVRFACLGHDLGKGTTPPEMLPRHLAPRGAQRRAGAGDERAAAGADNACRALAELIAREHGNVHRSGEFGAAALVRLLERCDALRRPERFAELLLACECDARGRLGLEERALSAASAPRRSLAPGRRGRRHRGRCRRQRARRERPGDRPGDPRRAGRSAARSRAAAGSAFG